MPFLCSNLPVGPVLFNVHEEKKKAHLPYHFVNYLAQIKSILSSEVMAEMYLLYTEGYVLIKHLAF